MIPCRKSCVTNYAPGSPESVLLNQLAQTGKERPVTVGYPQFTTSFSDVIYKLRTTNDISATVDAAANELQSELDKR